ncbi:hypothetical protein N2152v2_009428 [Parachlorella kessleri]
MDNTTPASPGQATNVGGPLEQGPSNVNTALPPPIMPRTLPNSPLALYQPVRFLGQGGFGFVVLSINRMTGEMVAIKFVECKTEASRKIISREVANHLQLRHPHVVELREVLAAPPYVGIVMEYVSGGTLFDYVAQRGGLPEPEARWFFQQLLIGLDYCHRRGVMNRDIKLQNTLLAPQPAGVPPMVKLCDFGYSKHEDFDSVAKSCVGTPAYIAPEVMNTGRAYDGKQADVWSAGVMLFAMIFSKYPFEQAEDARLLPAERGHRMMKRIAKGHWEVPDDPQVSDSCRDLLLRVLVKDPTQRLTLGELMKHPWFAEGLPPGSLEYNELALQSHPPPTQQPHLAQQAIDQVLQSCLAAAAPTRGRTDAAPLLPQQSPFSGGVTM